jgi:tRNA-2-methylthio-N6-dimethylallyladenosine synthase
MRSYGQEADPWQYSPLQNGDARVPAGNYYIETYGCQMNDHDSEKMSALLEQTGLTEVSSPDQADVVIINTCSIRDKSEHKVYSALGKLKPLKARNPRMITVVAGCVAQQEKDRLLNRVGHLDLVLGTHSIADLPVLLERIRKSRERLNYTDFVPDVTSLHIPSPRKGKNGVCSYVTIMQGCSNFCTYCVVPFTRGPEQSRPQAEIIEEVRVLARSGVKEVTLLGQNVNAYGKDLNSGESFVQLLTELDRIPGIRRIRFTTSHPKDFTDDMARAMADLESVCEHVHLPLQSGSDRVLKAMNRRYTRSEYLEKVAGLRKLIPGVAITTDIIVGFPGETEFDFSETISALTQIRYDQIFSFKFSPRPGTAGCRLSDQILEEIKRERLAAVHALQDEITARYHQDAEGTVEEVLIEGIRLSTGQAFGRTRTNKIVNLQANDSVEEGDLVNVRLIRGLKHSLLGRLLR